jgi:hypothetical protein
MGLLTTVPIVFVNVADPVGAGYVNTLARPGGNAVGFMSIEYSMGGKWLELLKQIAPGVKQAAILRDPTQGSGTSQFAAIQAVVPSLRVEVSPVNVSAADEFRRGARKPWLNRVLVRSWSAVRHFSTASASNLSYWQHATACLRSTNGASSPRTAALETGCAEFSVRLNGQPLCRRQARLSKAGFLFSVSNHSIRKWQDRALLARRKRWPDLPEYR